MKAIVVEELGGPEVLQLREVPEPTPQDGQVAVRVELASLNFADVMARQGRYHGGSTPPFIPGLDLVGTVLSVGPNVDPQLVGQRVIGFPSGGSYQEIAICDQRMIAVAPKGIPLSDLGASPLVLCTALELLRRGMPPNTRAAAVYAAAGGVGLTLIQLLRYRNIAQIIGLVGSKEKGTIALQWGATDAVVYRGEEKYEATVNEITEGRGVDVVFNSVAGTTSSSDLAMVGNFGSIVVYGMASGSPGTYHSNDLHGSSRTVVGFSFGTLRRTRPDEVPELLSRATTTLTSTDLHFSVQEIYSPFDAPKAHALLESGTSHGKLLLDFT